MTGSGKELKKGGVGGVGGSRGLLHLLVENPPLPRIFARPDFRSNPSSLLFARPDHRSNGPRQSTPSPNPYKM